MHRNSLLAMKKTLAMLDAHAHLRVLDIGSRVYGEDTSYRDVLPSASWEYVGIDMSPGDNVHCVVEPTGGWPFPDAHFDVVISGQCIEHCGDPPALFRELGRVLKPGGLACVIAPWCWGIHRCPRDYWRILPDGMHELLERYAGLNVLRTFTIEVRLENVVAAGSMPVGDLLVRAPDGDGPGTPLRDYVIEGGSRLGEIVVEGDCVGVAIKPRAGDRC